MGAINVHSPLWIQTFLDTIPAEQTAKEVDFLAAILPLFTHARVLDVCCGDGRHARPLALAGYAVTGIDWNPELIDRARLRWREDGTLAFGTTDEADPRAPVFRVHDMRELLALRDTFDAVICMWTSFGTFDAAANAEVLRQMAGCVRAGGRVVLDLYNPEFFERHQGVRERVHAGRAIREETTCANGVLDVHLRYDDGSEDRFRWQLLTPGQLDELARSVGLGVTLRSARFDPAARPSADDPRVQIVLDRGFD